jgi:hypothetical protein
MVARMRDQPEKDRFEELVLQYYFVTTGSRRRLPLVAAERGDL